MHKKKYLAESFNIIPNILSPKNDTAKVNNMLMRITYIYFKILRETFL